MDFKNKIKARIFVNIILSAIGLFTIVFANITKVDNGYMSALGFALFVCGAANIRKNRIIIKSDAALEKRKIAESDERNIFIAYRARTVAYTVSVCAFAVGSVVLNLMNKTFYATASAFCACAIMLVYLVAYFIISKKS